MTIFVVLTALGASLMALAAGAGLGLLWSGKKRTAPKRRISTSKLIALGILLVDAAATFAVLYLCWLAIVRQFTGALPYLTTLIGALQAATGYVLGHYFQKSRSENTQGGIVYDTTMKSTSGFDTAGDL